MTVAIEPPANSSTRTAKTLGKILPAAVEPLQRKPHLPRSLAEAVAYMGSMRRPLLTTHAVILVPIGIAVNWKRPSCSLPAESGNSDACSMSAPTFDPEVLRSRFQLLMKEHRPKKMGSNELARAAELTPGAVSKVLSPKSAKKRTGVTFETVAKMAYGLRASLDWLAYGKGPKKLPLAYLREDDDDNEESDVRRVADGGRDD